MDTLHARRTVGGIVLHFTWHGGAYIDVRAPWLDHPSEVINVWDHENEGTRYPFTKAGLGEAVDSWLTDYAEEGDLYHDVTRNWS